MDNFDSLLIGLQLFIAITAISKYFGYASIGDKNYSYSLLFLILTFLYAYSTNFISTLGLIWLCLLSLFSAIAAHSNTKIIKSTAYLLGVLLFLILGFKLLPGFDSPLIIENQALKSGSTSYSKQLSLDKILSGLTVFVIFIPIKKTISRKKIFNVLIISLVTSSLVLSLGRLTMLIQINFDYQVSWSFILYFIFIQVFFVALIEETFFRGLIQEKLYQIFKPYSYYYNLIPLSVTAILFGLVHLGGGWIYACLSMLAGLGYGVVYQNTRRVEVSVFAHTLLNTLHLLCFTYPLAT